MSLFIYFSICETYCTLSGVEVGVGDTACLDPGKALLVLLAVSFEHRVVRLLFGPLLEGPGLPAGLLPLGHRTLTVLRADPSGLREPAAAVLAAPHGDPTLHAAAQSVVDHIPNGTGVQNRGAPSRLHRLKTKGDGPEGKQLRILGRVIEVLLGRLLLGIPSGPVHIQHQIKKSLDLLLIPGQKLREGLQLLQHLLVLRASPVTKDAHSGEAVVPARIQKLQIDVPALQLPQLHHGVGVGLTVILCNEPAPTLRVRQGRRAGTGMVHGRK